MSRSAAELKCATSRDGKRLRRDDDGGEPRTPRPQPQLPRARTCARDRAQPPRCDDAAVRRVFSKGTWCDNLSDRTAPHAGVFLVCGRPVRRVKTIGIVVKVSTGPKFVLFGGALLNFL